MRLPAGYSARQIRFLGLWEHEGWRMKVYGIAFRGEAPRPRVIEAARALAQRCLPLPAQAPGRYGVGFLGAHEGRDADLVFVDWWANGNELHHHVALATPDAPAEFREVTGTGLAGCVWDLAVIGFERRAWIAAVLLGSRRDALDDYLAARFEGAV